MEKTTIYAHNYKIRTIEILRSHLQYILIGSFAVSFIAAFIYFNFVQKDGRNANTLGMMTDDTEIAQAPQVEVLTKKLRDKSISYISSRPSKNPESLSTTKVEENGQITAIASGKVTYTKNTYIVQEGDSLASIAEQVYGDRNSWARIAVANDLASPDAIEIGMELIIPR